jgi:hypothetical protein
MQVPRLLAVHRSYNVTRWLGVVQSLVGTTSQDMEAHM